MLGSTLTNLIFAETQGRIRAHTFMTKFRSRSTARLIYADTSIWNRLYEEGAAAEALMKGLAARDAKLVLGSNVLYEMAKSFRRHEAKGRELFRYVKRYVVHRIPCLAETRILLQREAERAAGEANTVNPFWTAEQHAELVRSVEDLSRGEIDPFLFGFVARRMASAQSVRDDLRQHLDAHPELKHALAAIAEESLPQWLEKSMRGPAGRSALQRQLGFALGMEPDRHIRRLAKKLISRPGFRVSKALARSDLYLNWRCAQRDSIRGDIPDDAYHTVNASPCDVFLTTEPDQANHARLFSPHMRTFVFEGQKPLIDWLLSGPFGY